ncbi:uroporphyrinogen-III synthase [Actinotalea sp. Marseille-Q4924]|uniref:uroporphyrinogen-III synthase n=1 Tax=Actinotalea sp. Marseille-Q4924 TaxID=2866571 RepID=UPI001CE41688|nr:uroporphyrinogen-III synthase [Actinotalea sp. Marseille-Q4924]
MTPAAAAGRLPGWRVLVPHGGDWGDRVGALLAAEGAEAVVVPLIVFAPPEDVGALDSAVERLAGGGYDWTTVTSGTTVTALAERVRALHGPQARLADGLGDTRVAAVGPGTARVLADHGVVPDLLPTGERSAAGLVAAMTALPDDGARHVLVPRSDLAEPTVVEGLRAAGWAVDDVVAYRTAPGPPPDDDVRTAWRSGAVDAVLLSSASTARNLVDLLGPPPSSVVVCCIGSRTTAAARALGLRVDVVPRAASAEELVDALAAHADRPAPSLDRSPL